MNNLKYNGYNGAIYAVEDTVADQLIGTLTVHKHESAAIRFFTDIATMQGSIIAQHPHDFRLIRLGYITHNRELVAERSVVLEGEAWAAARNTTKMEDR